MQRELLARTSHTICARRSRCLQELNERGLEIQNRARPEGLGNVAECSSDTAASSLARLAASFCRGAVLPEPGFPVHVLICEKSGLGGPWPDPAFGEARSQSTFTLPVV